MKSMQEIEELAKKLGVFGDKDFNKKLNIEDLARIWDVPMEEAKKRSDEADLYFNKDRLNDVIFNNRLDVIVNGENSRCLYNIINMVKKEASRIYDNILDLNPIDDDRLLRSSCPEYNLAILKLELEHAEKLCDYHNSIRRMNEFRM